jgi:hypothetical protein
VRLPGFAADASLQRVGLGNYVSASLRIRSSAQVIFPALRKPDCRLVCEPHVIDLCNADTGQCESLDAGIVCNVECTGPGYGGAPVHPRRLIPLRK